MSINQSFSFLHLKQKHSIGKLSRCPSMASVNTRSSSRASNKILPRPKPLRVSASAFCVLDTQTGWILASRRDLELREIASLTKIMTAFTVIKLQEQGLVSFEDVVKVSKAASKINGTSAELKENDEITLIDLLYALMLPSGNDAACALAEHCGHELGTQGFVSQMNLNCKNLGLNSTVFRNPHGMATSKNLSNARDVCKMAQVAMENETFANIVATKEYTACVLNCGKVKVRTWTNTNKMLDKGFVGVKTGVTPTAGPCLCTAYGNFVITLLNSRSMDDRWRETEALLALVQVL